MSKKAWTPDNCPLQVGSVLHHTTTNTDYIAVFLFVNNKIQKIQNYFK